MSDHRSRKRVLESKTNRRELSTDPVPGAGHSQKQRSDPRRHKGRHLERNHPSHGHSDLQQGSEPLSLRPESEENVRRALRSPPSIPRSLATRSPRGPSHLSCTVPEAFPSFRCRRYRIPVEDGQGSFSTSSLERMQWEEGDERGWSIEGLDRNVQPSTSEARSAKRDL